jgi:hypothetical protein
MPTISSINPNLDNNWQGPDPTWTRNWTISTRIDHRFSDKDQFYARYSQGNHTGLQQFYSQPMLNLVPGTNRRTAPNKALALSEVHTFSPRLFNELLVSASRQIWFKSTGEPNTKYATQMGLPNPLGFAGWPGLYGAGLNGYNYYFETDNTQGAPVFFTILDDNATMIKGKHEMQFGFHFRYDQLNLLPDQQHIVGSDDWYSNGTCLYDITSSRTDPSCASFTGDTMGNFYLGSMTYRNNFARGYFYTRAKEYALYYQDNFRVNSRLTLNLGLRWELYPAFTEKNKLMTSFDKANHAIVLARPLDQMINLGYTLPAIVDPLTALGVKFETAQQAGLPAGLMNNNYNDFAPRLGFAYRLSDSFVVRGGYSMSYFHIPPRMWTATMRSNTPLTGTFANIQTDSVYTPDGISNYLLRSVPTIIAGRNSSNAVTLTGPSGMVPGSAQAYYFDPSEPDPRIQNWNFTLEKQVMRNTVARAGFIGNHSSNLEQFYQYNNGTPDYIWYATTHNPIPTGEFSRVARNPYDNHVYGAVNEYMQTGWGNYSAAQFELERRYSQGYGYQLTYLVGNNYAAGGSNTYGGNSVIPATNQYLPGAVPADLMARNALLNYQRDTSVPKHRVRWNWIADLPIGKGKALLGNAGPVLNRIAGGWQIAGMGSLQSTYGALPTSIYPTTGNPIEIYGYKYPIQDCTSGTCYPGYLWWNGYIPANKINSVDANGKPNGYEGIPANYKPAGQPFNPWPANPDKTNPAYRDYGTNNVYIPLSDGTTKRVAYNDNFNPWRQQYFPGPREWNVDASLFKVVPIKERFNLRINLDAFNVFNHPGNGGGGGTSLITVPATGILSTKSGWAGASPRVLQLTGRLTW